MDNLWLPIPGFPGYEASSNGLIRSMDREVISRWGTPRVQPGIMLKLGADKDGYLRCTLFVGGKRYPFGVHQLIALTFVGERPEGAQVHHKNDNKQDNRAANIEYLTPFDHNSLHKSNGGSSLRGTRHWKNRLTEDQAIEIKHLLQAGELKQGQIAARYGVTRTLINEINMGRVWRWLHA